MKNILVVLLTIFSIQISAAEKHQFSLGKEEFLLDGKPIQLISGEIHPSRVPRIYWKHRIQMAKAMGCNTIAVYVFWNYHENQEGKFDFSTDNKNIPEFIRLCQEEGLWVLLRPGPYVCGEWDLGGLPWWLLKTPDIKLRCMDPRYLSAVKAYVDEISRTMKPLLCTQGGPVLMVQLENEYGSYGNDREYMKTLYGYWKQNGMTEVPFYTADGPTPFMLEAGTFPGCAIGLDSGKDSLDFAEAFKLKANVPVFSSETYPGWLTHWKENYARPDTTQLLKEIRYLLEHKKSFNFYVIHGGTNFGYWAGANAFNPTQYQPDLTTYDYDAPINEQGQPTTKYFALRNLISKYADHKLADIPECPQAVELPEFKLTPYTSIWNNLPKAVKSPQPVPMEMLGQEHGFILYKTKLIGHKSGKLTITEPHDLAWVFLDGVLVDTINRDGGRWTIDLPKTAAKEPVLEILVEGMGRINFAQYMIDRKGITDRVSLNGMTLMNWDIYSLPFEDEQIRSLKANNSKLQNGIFLKGEFFIDKPADTYLDLSKFAKGLVWVNGHNLGRYWNAGPQYRLYCPANFMKKGKNEVIVLDMFGNTEQIMKGFKTLE